MPVASLSSLIVGCSIAHTSHIVMLDAIAENHRLCGDRVVTGCDITAMDIADDKNGGPNHVAAWRRFRNMTQAQLAEAVGTNQNMIGYLESGERGLSAKWLRRLSDALDTTSGLLLDHDPYTLDSDLIDIWVNASSREKRQLSDIAKTVVRTGTEG